MTAREAQETTITWYRDDAEVSIYTSNLPHLRKLESLSKSHDFVRKVEGGDDWGDFRVKIQNFKIFSAIRALRTVSAAQRKAAAERMRNLRRPAPVDEEV
ncbi:hypothetical protein [Microbacterium xylanilyticum]